MLNKFRSWLSYQLHMTAIKICPKSPSLGRCVRLKFYERPIEEEIAARVKAKLNNNS